MKRTQRNEMFLPVSCEDDSADSKGDWSEDQERLRAAVRSLDRKLVRMEESTEMVTALDQLLADKTGFWYNRSVLLDAWKNGNLYTMCITETDDLYKDRELLGLLGDFLGARPHWLQLPVLCLSIDGETCEILWVAKHVRRLGLGSDIVHSLGIKRAVHVLDDSRGFWERTGVSIEDSVS